MKLLTTVIGIVILISSNLYASTDDTRPVKLSPRSDHLIRQIDQALESRGNAYKPRTEHLRADGSPKYTNRLILEDSPYLVQHAHNPVDWYPWDAEAFATAKRENKPVFLSIGYSTCHWCHVMERESFENEEIANFLNQNFIAIKVDRERRPDVDKTYMQAVMLMAGNGGWPMSSFLTPEGKPFFGGTYYPAATFLELTRRVSGAWSDQQNQLLLQGDRVADAVARVGQQSAEAGKLGKDAVTRAVKTAVYNHDEFQGGFGTAPKFPHEPLLFLLIGEAERDHNPETLAAIEVTLDAMSRGGIYDQVGGGFHRYSTDSEWLVPHFEKMLYNQARLARVYLLAWRLTGNPLYRRIATQTFDYVLRDMTSPHGAFYSATDADSEGGEGSFFLWTTEQIRAALPARDAKFAIELFGISDSGNFESSNILHIPVPLPEFARQNKLSLPELITGIDAIRLSLYKTRGKREHPLRDEKILTAWNGMMISSLAQAGAILNEARYTQAAIRSANFVWEYNRPASGELYRVHLDGSSSIPAHQEDYAYFAEGLLHLYDVTADPTWLNRAREVADGMILRFWDDKNGGFYMSREEGQLTTMARAKDDGSDNAIPSGNSVAVRVLQMLNIRSTNLEYGKTANATLAAFGGAINQTPTSYGYMLAAASDLQNGELGATRYIARGGVRVKAKQTGANRATVELHIPAGWHINSNKPLQTGLIPTSLKLGSNARGWHLNNIDYPESVTANLGFQSEVLSLYQGKVQIQLELSSNAQSSHILPLKLGIQACNDEICLPPETLTLGLAMQDSDDS